MHDMHHNLRKRCIPNPLPNDNTPGPEWPQKSLILSTFSASNRPVKRNLIMRDLPKSVFSTPGMTALHPAGAVPEANKTYGGLQMAWVARTAAITLSRVPCFGHMTTKLKGTGEPYRGACLVVAFLFAEHKPDHVIAVCVWIIGEEELCVYQDQRGIFRGHVRGDKESAMPQNAAHTHPPIPLVSTRANAQRSPRPTDGELNNSFRFTVLPHVSRVQPAHSLARNTTTPTSSGVASGSA